ncbi:MAG: TonB-dependent receptor, partial [Candidatus Hydrogenedentes bacterium]|nr:TonB-dependent receptor [Candidatus Hydrogenedentota bacterium]
MIRHRSLVPAWIWRTVALLAVVAPSGTGEENVSASGEINPPEDLTEMGLQDLMNLRVTSVSKKSEQLGDAPAAIYVLTQEDIRRSGATTIPDLLRTVPGLSVARVDSSSWSVTARGFGGVFANKLLVLVDGRSVYTNLYSGVYWENLNLVMEDIERVEIIRGPGGTLWGANAVNGVINIITKSAGATQGGLLTAGAGTEDRGFGALRYGGQMGRDAYYRAYLGYGRHDEGPRPSGAEGNDDWDSGFGGFRIDLTPEGDDSFTLLANLYGSRTDYMIDVPIRIPPFAMRRDGYDDYAGGNVVALWRRQPSEDSELQLQAYYDYFESNGISIQQSAHTIDLDFQQRSRLGHRHELMWGLGLRHVADSIDGTATVTLDPGNSRTSTISGFVQDEISFWENRLNLTLGIKLEYNDVTELEFQPNALLVWTPNDRHTLWASVSRAIRSPSRVERAMRLESYTFRRVVASYYGNPDLDSEYLLAFEAGYRVQLSEEVALDIAAFCNRYDDLRTGELRRPFLEVRPLPTHLAIPIAGDSNMDGYTYGVEVALDWQPAEWWRVRAGYTYFEADLSVHPRTVDLISAGVEDDTPEQQYFMQHRFDLPHHTEIDATLRYVDSIDAFSLDGYVTMDIRLGWHPRENLEVSLAGQNLFDGTHKEYDTSFLPSLPTEVERGVYGT